MAVMEDTLGILMGILEIIYIVTGDGVVPAMDIII